MKSQADCYRALLDGKTLVNKNKKKEVKIDQDGALVTSENIYYEGAFICWGDWKIKQEPKKLYAYRDGFHEIRFSTLSYLKQINGIKTVRCPEYDLVFDDSDRRSSEYPCK